MVHRPQEAASSFGWSERCSRWNPEPDADFDGRAHFGEKAVCREFAKLTKRKNQHDMRSNSGSLPAASKLAKILTLCFPFRTAMKDEERFKLLFGPYQPPKTRRGKFLCCEMRGTVKVGGYGDGPIPWPVKWGTRNSLILCGDLARAVQGESAQGVAHHWGVRPSES